MDVGVFITRAEPFHKGHLDVIEQALEENDKVLVIIGSANKVATKRNPFDLILRYNMVHSVLKDRCQICTLDDWSMEDYSLARLEWGSYLYYNIVSRIGQKTFTLYYNEDINIATSWFEPNILNRILIKNSKRGRNVSSTQVRGALKENDLHYLRQALPAEICNEKYINEMRHQLENADKEDFIMQ